MFVIYFQAGKFNGNSMTKEKESNAVSDWCWMRAHWESGGMRTPFRVRTHVSTRPTDQRRLNRDVTLYGVCQLTTVLSPSSTLSLAVYPIFPLFLGVLQTYRTDLDPDRKSPIDRKRRAGERQKHLSCLYIGCRYTSPPLVWRQRRYWRPSCCYRVGNRARWAEKRFVFTRRRFAATALSTDNQWQIELESSMPRTCLSIEQCATTVKVHRTTHSDTLSTHVRCILVRLTACH